MHEGGLKKMQMKQPAKMTNSYGCKNEYDTLKRVIVCPPTYMKIEEIINETQKHYADENIDESLASKQHRQFVECLQKEGVEVIGLSAQEPFPEQVFTRDIGYTLGDTIIVTKMGSEIRSGEEQVLAEWLQQQGIPFHQVPDHPIEGGDVLIDGQAIFIALSDRTSKEGVQHIQGLLPTYEVVPIPIDRSYLHLDCVLNILSPTEALVFSPALHEKELNLLRMKYDLIEVTKKEQFTMGTNVLSVGNQRVISLPMNTEVNEELRKRGYKVIEVDISEIIKSGGSFRCCTMPLERV